MSYERLSRVCSDFETQLSGAIAVGATSFTIQSVLDLDGTILSNGIYCFTIDRDSTGAKEYLVGQLDNSTKTISSISSVGRQGALTANAQRKHRIGANVIISDHSALNAIVKILNGTGTIDPSAPISYDSEPTLSAREQIATVGYVIDTASGGTVSFDKQIIAGTAGETVVAGNIVYQKVSDSRWWKADANVTATVLGVKFGVALGSGTAGNAITGGVQLSGVCSAFTGLTANTNYYLSDTAGAVSTSVGTVGVTVGLATSTTAINLNFSVVASETTAGYVEEATDAEVTAGTATGATGSKLFVTPTKLLTNLSSKFKFGGTGADGALNLTSTTQNIDCAGAQVVVKNYTSISITGTGKLTFSNSHANGTTVILKSQGNVTLTSSQTPMIDMSGIGARGAQVEQSAGNNSVSAQINKTLTCFGIGGAGVANGVGSNATGFCAGGGAAGYSSGYAGGRGGNGCSMGAGGGSNSNISSGGNGGGCLLIECAGAWNFTTTNGISVAGSSSTYAGGGGGGVCMCLYNSLTANTGTINVSGGIGGTYATYKSGDGSSGYSLVALNTELS